MQKLPPDHESLAAVCAWEPFKIFDALSEACMQLEEQWLNGIFMPGAHAICSAISGCI